MAVGQILGGLVGAEGVLRGFEETLVGGRDLLGQLDFAVGGLAEIEVRGALFLETDVQDHVAGVAADGFEMRFDDVGDIVDALFDVAFGGREEVAFMDSQGLAHFRSVTRCRP